MEVTLSPGDAVFFPAYWAHHTESLDESVSVTCRLAAAAAYSCVCKLGQCKWNLLAAASTVNGR